MTKKKVILLNFHSYYIIPLEPLLQYCQPLFPYKAQNYSDFWAIMPIFSDEIGKKTLSPER